MREICCKRKKMKMNVFVGEFCSEYGGCPYNMACGAIRSNNKNKIGEVVKIHGRDSSQDIPRSKEIDRILDGLYHRRKWMVKPSSKVIQEERQLLSLLFKLYDSIILGIKSINKRP